MPQRLGGPAPPPGPGAVLVVGCLRNEMLRLPDFLAHYRALGAARFLLIDNASDDGSTGYLQAQPDVELFVTDEPYSASACGVTWTNAVLAARAAGHWTVIVDIDELLVYPSFETAGLPALAGWLDAQGAQAMAAPMLDMYPAGPLAQADYRAGASLIAAAPWFDATGYSLATLANGCRVIHRGGPRKRLFWDGHDRPFPPPVLVKYPLVRWRADLALEASTHVLRGAAVAPVTGLLLHFKFLQDFAAATAAEAARGEHYMGARQYRAYSDVMGADPDLRVDGAQSIRYRDSRQLAELGLMQVPLDYPL